MDTNTFIYPDHSDRANTVAIVYTCAYENYMNRRKFYCIKIYLWKK